MKSVDNATYKQQYHFKDDFKDTAREHPSINAPEKINSTIKENPYRSNVEIEGGEVVLQPDLSALFKANGKKHSSGGMDVYLRPDSFVFSDFKDLSITEKEKELFELKMGGSAKGDSTPANTVKQNVNAKHYNSLINNITDLYKDDLARKSSAMMLEKYIQTLGNIAFLQEKKKEFPDGLPNFSLGTAPVFDEDKKEHIDESKQYAKYGGVIGNSSMQFGGLKTMVKSNPKNEVNTTASTNPRQDRYIGKYPPYPQKWNNYYDKISKTQYTAPDWINPSQFYAVPGLVDYMKTLDKQKGIDWDMSKADDAQWGWRHQAALAKFFPNGNKPATPQIPTIDRKTLLDQVGQNNIKPHQSPDLLQVPLNPGEVDGEAQGMKRADWQFTPWQKLSQAYNWGQVANVKRYMPYRSRYNATYADPSLVNPEQAIGDVKGSLNQQISSLSTLNPIMRNAQAAASYGQVISQIPGIRSQYDNQNSQIMNQFRQYNNQVRNNESMVNMANDQTYYQQAIEGRKNFDNMRQFTANNAMNNVLRDVETNQKLAYNMLTLNNPAYGYDWKTGDFYRNKKDIMDVQSASNQQENLLQLAEDLKQKGYSEKLIGDILKTKAFQTWQPTQVPRFKKGGKTKNPYK